MAQDRERASLDLLYSISRELASSLDLQTVLARVLKLSTTNVGAERGSLIVINDAGVPVEAAIVIHNKTLHPTVIEMQAILDRGLAGWVAKNRLPALVSDTSQDERWTRRPDDESGQTGRKSAICVPLLVRDKLAGILTLVHARTGFFREDHLLLLQAIADLAGVAVRNAYLYASVQEAQRRYHELFEDSIDPILITNQEGRILEANRRAVEATGREVAELAGLNVLDLHEANLGRLGVRFSALGGGQTVSYESELRTPEDQPRPVEVHVRRVIFEEEELLQWILRDIRERKELDVLRNDLSAMIYHDLRSPLANIISSLDILGTVLPLEENTSASQLFQIAQRSTERLQRLISSLLDVNRLEAGQPIANKRPIAVEILLEDGREAIRPLVESKKQKLNLVLPASLPDLVVDADMIRRVVINLLENALKFTPMEGLIELGAREEPGMVIIWVADSGPGIPAEAREKIFEKFSRLKVEGTPKGFGLGLTFCRLAIRAHGGKIWVENNPGGGSRFIFCLPVPASA